MADTLVFSLLNTMALPGYFKAFKSEYNILQNTYPRQMHIHTFTQTLSELKILRRTNKGLISLLLPFSGDVNWGQEHYGIEFPHDTD